MNLSIDWGTLIVSVPVIAATCFGAIKFIGKAYLKEHFDQRLESFKTELFKDTEKYKSELEKEKNFYLKELELQATKSKQMFDMYSKDSYPKSLEVRDQTRKFLKVYNSTTSSIRDCLDELNVLTKMFDNNKVHISPQFNDLLDELVLILQTAIYVKENFYHLKNEGRNEMSDFQLSIAIEDAYNNHVSHSDKINSICKDIDNLLRDELNGSV
ncbi:hypothetical protein MHB54_00310 [Paenibacillus sp. FSL M7-0802]|uniref:hypothetical protein n=1 Tax=Paenibacillus sp. FSL M7-0802 TaxID=2921536 RepID=UPI0030F93A19